MDSKSFESELNEEVQERIALMEDPSYEFPAALTKVDWVAIALIPTISIILLVLGEFL